LEIVIKDPVENFREENSTYEALKEEDKPLATTNWKKDDKHKMIPKPLEILNDLRDPRRKKVDFNGTTCWQLGGDPLKPRSDKPVITIDKSLLPSKLYNVVVFNEYEGAKAQIHAYPFQTSRYANLGAHIGSYQQENDLREKRNAIFEIAYQQENDLGEKRKDLATMLKIASEDPSVDNDLLETYSDVYQRLVDGYLALKNIAPPVCTEFNFLKNKAGETVGIWIRTTEPINDPRMPYAELSDTIIVTGATDYTIVHSSDRSCAMIVFESPLPAALAELKIKFTYKNWNGTEYAKVANYPTENLI